MDEDRIEAVLTDAEFRAADREDLDYYRNLAMSVQGPVLELGCGSGRIYLELLSAGVDVDGIDTSLAALSLLKSQANEQELDPCVWQAEMTTVGSSRQYALVYCPFNTVQVLTNPGDQRSLFTHAYELLAPGGSFVFDVFVPDYSFIANTWGEWQDSTLTVDGDRIEYRTRTRMTDEITQDFVTEKRAFTASGERLFSSERRATLLSFREIEARARASPFDHWTVTGDYTDEELTDGHSVQIWTLVRDETAS